MAINFGQIIGNIGRGISDTFNNNLKDRYASPLLNKTPVPGPSAADQRRQQLISDQEKAIADFEKNRAQRESEAIRQTTTATKQALQDRLRGERSSFASRGLLYSGLREEGEARARGEAAANVAKQKESINRSFMSAKNRLDELYNKMRFGAAEQAVIDADTAYETALSEAQGNMGAIGALGSALGAGVGGFLGARK